MEKDGTRKKAPYDGYGLKFQSDIRSPALPTIPQPG